jgi:hypothetical protein
MRNQLLAEIDNELLGGFGTPQRDPAIADERRRVLERVRDDLQRRELSSELLWFVAERASKRAGRSSKSATEGSWVRFGPTPARAA